MSELCLSIVECRYPDDIQDQLLKDQYILVLCVKEIQDHLLGETVPEDTAEKCLLELRKIKFKIEQGKLLSRKTSMTYNAIYRGKNKLRNKSRDHSQSNGRMCKYCGRSHNRGNCPVFGKKMSEVWQGQSFQGSM